VSSSVEFKVEARRSIAEWLTLAATAITLALLIKGAVCSKIFSQQIWEPKGLQRLCWFVEVYAAMVLGVWSTLRWLLPIAIIIAMFFSAVVSVGLAPILTVVLLLCAALAVGDLVVRGAAPLDNCISVACGLGLYATLFGLTAHIAVNYPVCWLALLVMPCVFRLARFKSLFQLKRWRPEGAEFWAAALLGLVLSAHWLISLTPEVGADALATHLAIPAYVARHHQWSFDFTTFIWAVMPMNGDWIYSIAYLLGSEGAARLTNFATMAILSALIFQQVKRNLSTGAALLVTGAFASTPLVQHETGSLFIENFWALQIFAAACALLRFHETRGRRWIGVSSLLLGVALATKLGSVPYIVVLATLLTVEISRHHHRIWLAPFSVLAFGTIPYLYAWRVTGNPCFPYLNRIFHSPWFDRAAPMVDPRFPSRLSTTVLWDITFKSSNFLEGQNGSVGFWLFLLLPSIVVLLVFRRSIYFAWISAILIIVSGLAVLSTQAYLRYLYPSLPFISMLIALPLRCSPTWIAHRVYGTLMAAATLTNVYLLPTAGWYHRDFYIFPPERDSYIAAHAPERLAVAYLNSRHPGAPTGFLTTDAIAGFNGMPYTPSWHTPRLATALQTFQTASDVVDFAERHGIRTFIGPTQLETLQTSTLEDFVARCAIAEWARGGISVLTLRQVVGRDACIPRTAVLPDSIASVPGDYDDRDPRVVFTGTWWRDDQFRSAWAGTLTYSNRAGDEAEFTFQGQSIQYCYTRAANRGIAVIEVDDTSYGPLDLYAPHVAWRTCTTWALARNGLHTFKVRVAADHNSASTGTFVDVDKVAVR